MIGSFWNLCRACPSMPVDKLHSEYRSTYRWHEYTGPRQEVVRRPPESSVAVPSAEKPNDLFNSSRVHDDDTQNELPKLEPALPRRKKHPDLAYRHHEFLVSDSKSAANDSSNAERARSEERGASHWRPSRRSKSEGPARGSVLESAERRRDSDPDLEKTGRETGLLRKAISKISTEYRLQFAWPAGHTSRRDATDSTPRKSQSMGVINPAANAIVHRKRTDFVENKDASELEPLVNDSIIREEVHKISDYSRKFRNMNHDYIEERHGKRGALAEEVEESKMKLINGNHANEALCKENYMELRKKAEQYRSRGWGSHVAPEKLTDIYNKQIELWDQVSRRSSLSALSLASTTHRSYTKEEKDEENTKKTSPTKAQRNAENSVRMMKDMIRHHLERTTGGSELDGLILSPTREKLEPTIPRKDDDSRSSQKNSPKKNSPQKSALQKRNSQKSKSGLKTTRSQSVGPADLNTEKRSPKRQSRSATLKEKKTTPGNESATRRPRPSSLNTTASSRSKSSSVPPKIEEDKLGKAKSNKSHSTNDSGTKDIRKRADAPKVEKTDSAEAPTLAEPEKIDLEPVVKSPPEPTRVKSPEQILMRSPDPVNWTVPLDTGKTFTVTQNVREGDIGTRPHSEVKAWTPPELPPPVAQSAPPQLSEQCKDQARRPVDNSSDTAASVQEHSTASSSDLDPTTTVISNEEHNSPTNPIPHIVHFIDQPKENPTVYPKTPIAQPSNYKILEAPSLISPTENRSLASEVLEKARNRFDSFWRKNSKDGN